MTSKAMPILAARSEQVSSLCELLAQAFSLDPLWLSLLPIDTERKRVLRLFYGHMLKIGFLYGEIRVAGDPPAGLAVWLPPGREIVSFGMDVRAGGVRLLGGVRPAVLRRAMAMEAGINRTHRTLLREPHLVLALLAVAPAERGRGIARALLADGLERAVWAGTPVYLETQNEAHIAFYERFGFRVAAKSPVPGFPELFTYFMLLDKKFEKPSIIR
jgi:ribosomal protein S18 acetylase RimI-like enzyme